MPYLDVVGQIRDLKWSRLSPKELQSVMLLSGYTAREFARSLRKTVDLYPESLNLAGVAAGELETTNLQFADFSGPGDHADFLWHFIEKYRLPGRCPQAVSAAGEVYMAAIEKLPDHVRAMSIFSREHELPCIFERILEAPDWSAQGLAAYRYYLERHILLDRQPGGHSELLEEFVVEESVMQFYTARLELYRCIPTLFA